MQADQVQALHDIGRELYLAKEMALFAQFPPDPQLAIWQGIEAVAAAAEVEPADLYLFAMGDTEALWQSLLPQAQNPDTVALARDCCVHVATALDMAEKAGPTLSNLADVLDVLVCRLLKAFGIDAGKLLARVQQEHHEKVERFRRSQIASLN